MDGKVIIPAFGHKRPNNATDFNDMEAYLGKDAVTDYFTNQLAQINGEATATIPDSPDYEQAAFISRPANMNTAPDARKRPALPPILPLRDPVAEPKTHFSSGEFPAIQKIWRKMPHKAISHTESGYYLLVSGKCQVIVTKAEIKLTGKPKHRPDAAYAAACEHARQLWGGRMEVRGDSQHCVKAWAYASVYGVQVTNFVPTDKEKLEAEKIIRKLHKGMEPTFSRPSAVKPPNGAKPSV